jgi:hypothetical protein
VGRAAQRRARGDGRGAAGDRVGGRRARDGESGFLVPPERLHRFAEETAAVLARPAATLAAIGARARDRVCRDFTLEAERDAMLGVWRSLST